jgi:hypothetical protein
LWQKTSCQEPLVAAAARLLSWLMTTENAAEIAGDNLPGANANTNATNTATNASIAAYSVMPCPDRLFLLLVNDFNLDFIAQNSGGLGKYKRGCH